MLLILALIAFFPHNAQFQAFDGILWTGFDAGPCHIEADTGGAVAVWIGHDGVPVWMNAEYSLVMKD